VDNIQTGLLIVDKSCPIPLPGKKAAPVPLTGVRVTGDILGRAARIKVSQRFMNREKKPIEAVYRFPLPESAAVSSFSARIGDRTITGRIEEREKAFDIYDEALSQGHGAFLMDQERPNIFTLSVGNLKPGTEAVIEVEYAQLLDLEGRKFRFSLPTTISPRYIPSDMAEDDGIPESARIHPEYAPDVPYGLSMSLNIHNSTLLESIESPSHPISFDMKDDPAVVSLSSESVRMDRDFILYMGRDKAYEGKAYRLKTPEGTFIQLDLLLGKDAIDRRASDSPEAASPPKEVVFLIDCSGSMGGDSIHEAKKALEICTRALEPGSDFNIVRFGSTFEALFANPMPYEDKTLGKAIPYLRQMRADLGGTEVFRPLEHILESDRGDGSRQRTVILITDGQVANEDQVMQLVRSHSSHTSLFTIGIGAGCNEYCIKALARAGNGASEFIYPGERIESKVLRLFQKISDCVLTEAQIAWPAQKVTEAPSRPALFLDSPISVFARCDKSSRGDTVEISAKVNGQAQRWEFPVIDLEDTSLPIPLFWARERIRDLEERGEGALGPGSRQADRKAKRVEEHVVELSKRFGLLSKSTSYVAVEEREEKDRSTGELQLRKVPVAVTAGWHGIGSIRGTRVPANYELMLACEAPDSFHEFDTMTLAKLSIDNADIRRRASAFPFRSRRKRDDLFGEVHIDGGTDFDIVLAILATQKAGGGMEITEEIAEQLNIDFDAFKNAVTNLNVENPSIDAHTLLSTAVLLHLLETRFAALSHMWSKVVKKSRKWLEKITDHHDVTVENKRLKDWIEDFTASGK